MRDKSQWLVSLFKKRYIIEKIPNAFAKLDFFSNLPNFIIYYLNIFPKLFFIVF